MRIVTKLATLGLLVAAPALYGANVATCTGCHGGQFEKVAMGKSKVVKDMSRADIVASLKGYKDGSYGGAMKGLMKGQVAKLTDADIEEIADAIKGGSAAPAAAVESKVIDINVKAEDPKRIAEEDLGNKKTVTEEALGLRKTDIYGEKDTTASKTDFTREAAGSGVKFERAFVNAPPMIPHDIEGMLPITATDNQCVGCHMPDVAKSVNATPIPQSHLTNYRPITVMKDGEVIQEGKVVGKDIQNTSDIVTVAHKMKGLNQARFNCSQCHAPQSNTDTVVANTFTPDFKDGKGKSSSTLIDTMNEGVE
jgi:cytochrome c-type protein NapB